MVESFNSSPLNYDEYIMFSGIDLTKVNGILLDLDDTVYLYEPCHHVSLDAMLSYFAKAFNIDEQKSKDIYLAARAKTHQNLNGRAASHSRLLYAKYMVEEVVEAMNPEFVLELENVYWDTFLREMKIDKEALKFLENCRLNNVKVVIVTDLTTGIQLKKVIKLGIKNYLTGIITSEEAGTEKPSPEPFNRALSLLNMSAEEVIMVGDNEKKDRKGAEALGIKWVHPFN